MDTAAYLLALTIMAFGVICAILPVVPGPPVVWLGAVFYGWQTQWQGIGWVALTVLFAVSLVGSTSDWWLSALLLKQAGGSLWATLGSFVGGIIGFFIIPVAGIILGSLLGVAAVVWTQHRDLRRVFRAGQGFLMGWLLSTIVEVLAALVMLSLFVVWT